PAGHPVFSLDPDEAIAAALADAVPGRRALGSTDLVRAGPPRDGYDRYDLTTSAEASLGLHLSDPARVRKVMFHRPDLLAPAYYVEIAPSAPGDVDGDAYGYVISAVDGRVLFRVDQTVDDSFGYRVWADTVSPFLPFDGPQGDGATPH